MGIFSIQLLPATSRGTFLQTIGSLNTVPDEFQIVYTGLIKKNITGAIQSCH